MFGLPIISSSQFCLRYFTPRLALSLAHPFSHWLFLDGGFSLAMRSGSIDVAWRKQEGLLEQATAQGYAFACPQIIAWCSTA